MVDWGKSIKFHNTDWRDVVEKERKQKMKKEILKKLLTNKAVRKTTTLSAFVLGVASAGNPWEGIA